MAAGGDGSRIATVPVGLLVVAVGGGAEGGADPMAGGWQEVRRRWHCYGAGRRQSSPQVGPTPFSGANAALWLSAAIPTGASTLSSEHLSPKRH